MTGFEKMVKMNVFGPKWAIFNSFDAEMAKTGFLGKKRKCHLRKLIMPQLWLCKKLEQTYERILRSKMYARTHERTEANLKVPTASGGGPKISKILWPDLDKLIKMSVFGPKWAIFGSFGPKMAKTGFFWKNSKMSLPYLCLLCRNFVQETRTNLWTDSEI